MTLSARLRFLEEAAPRWARLELELDRSKRRTGRQLSEFAALHRALCADVMRARSLGCEPEVLARLDALASRSHTTLYAGGRARLRLGVEVLARRFPATLRRRWPFFLAASLLFLLPALFGFVTTLFAPDFAARVMSPDALESIEAHRESLSGGRGESLDAQMFGFYIQHNIGIAFQCFATGLVFGLGSLFFTIYNGLMLGVPLAHTFNEGYGMNLVTWICGHGAFELTGIVIAAGGGLQMGYSLLDTRGLTRLGSLRRAGPELVELISGAAFLILIAAGIEGFWSPSSAPREIKWAVGAANAVLLAAYLLFAGRGTGGAPEPAFPAHHGRHETARARGGAA